MLPVQLKTLLGPWLLPPHSLILLGLAGLLLARRWRRTGFWLTTLSLLTLLLLSLPVVASQLARAVEAPYLGLDAPGARLPSQRIDSARKAAGGAPQAIVILGGGTRYDGADSVRPEALGSASLDRILHGRRVARETGLPILISGGSPYGDATVEAEVLAARLSGEFGQPVRWLEIHSRDTAENARNTRRILKAQGIDRIVLVTHALHMRRAEALFRAEGFAVVVPAAHDFLSAPLRFDSRQFSPSPSAMATSHGAIREMVGLAWLRLRPLLDGLLDRF